MSLIRRNAFHVKRCACCFRSAKALPNAGSGGEPGGFAGTTPNSLHFVPNFPIQSPYCPIFGWSPKIPPLNRP